MNEQINNTCTVLEIRIVPANGITRGRWKILLILGNIFISHSQNDKILVAKGLQNVKLQVSIRVYLNN